MVTDMNLSVFLQKTENLLEDVAFAEYGGSNPPRATTGSRYVLDADTIDRAVSEQIRGDKQHRGTSSSDTNCWRWRHRKTTRSM